MNHKQRGSIFGPLLLITAGIIFLLNNFGVLDWSIWAGLINLWPILLIAAGLDILIGRRSAIGSMIVALIIIAMLAGGVWWISTRTTGSANLRTYTIEQPLAGVDSAEIEIVVGAGKLNIGPLPEGDLLIAGTIVLPEQQHLNENFANTNGRARFEVHSSTANFRFPNSGTGNETWNLDLNRDIPSDLAISSGVGKSVLDLERLTLTNLDLNMGVGDVTLTLPRQGRLNVNIDGGIGTVKVIVPGGIAARINADAGLGRVNVGGDFERQGDLWVSPRFESATDRLDININGGIGNINIETGAGQ